MTSSGTPQRSADEGRDPAPGSGARTPRRVQWASSEAVRAKIPSPPRSLHELDEMGLDPNAFESLKNALEKHQSEEHLSNEHDLHERRTGLPSSMPVHQVAPHGATAARVPESQHNPFASPPVGPSGVHPTSDNPYSSTSAQISDSRRAGVSFTHEGSPTSDVIHSRLSSSTLVAQRTHDVPGEVWIDPLEREGLPVHAPISNVGNREGSLLRRRSNWARGSRDSDVNLGEKHIERLAEYQAAGVVRAHTQRGWGWLHRSHNRKRAAKSQDAHDGEREKADQGSNESDEKGKATLHTQHRHRHTRSDTENHATFAEGEPRRPGRVRKGVPKSWFTPAMHFPLVHTPHPEDHHHNHAHGPKLGNGVLSALLALYGHDHEHDDEGSGSEGSTPGGRSRSSSDASDEGNLPKPGRPWLSDEQDQSPSQGQKDVADKAPGKFGLGRSLLGGSASSILAHLRTPSLPAASTTAALIAGAGALSGAAAPQPATLAPNLKKAGYNLVRYSVEDTPDTAPRIPDITPRDHRRTRSSDSGTAIELEHPDTPAATIVGSPTGGSEGLADRYKGGHEHEQPVPTPGGRKGWAGRLKDLPLPIHFTPSHLGALSYFHDKGLTPGGSGTATPGTDSARGTPADEFGEKKDYFDLEHIEKEKQRIKEQEKKERKEREKQKEKKMRRKRRKAEVYITKHVAEILQRQEFIMKLARAMMMFGGPSHRLASQIQSTGRVLDLELSCMYLPDVMLIAFEDSATGTSNVKFIRQGSALDLEKLGEAHALHWNVIHDNMSVSAASASLDVLMRKKPLYNFLQLTLVGGMCSASICSVSFSGSFIDCLASAPLGALLVAIQLIGVRNELYANVFEITIATLLSFLSAALASTKHFCYSAVASSSVVLILPGFIVLSGSLELSSRSLVAGAVRLCFALMYSLFLGFGLAIGAELYESIIGRSVVGPTDYLCTTSHDPEGPWWQATPSLWWAFLTVPMYSLFLSLRLMAPWWKKEMLLLIVIASIGWVTNHFVGAKFPNQSDISAAVGAFVVGFISNIYGRFFNGNAFVVMITGILFQVPSGLGNGGLLNFVSDQASGSKSSYLSGFQTALQLISVAIGLTVGLGISLVIVHPIQSRRRASGLFSL